MSHRDHLPQLDGDLFLTDVIDAAPGSPVGGLLGASHRAVDLVFDHVALSGGSLTLTTNNPGGTP
jgi:hypothetical protein